MCFLTNPLPNQCQSHVSSCSNSEGWVLKQTEITGLLRPTCSLLGISPACAWAVGGCYWISSRAFPSIMVQYFAPAVEFLAEECSRTRKLHIAIQNHHLGTGLEWHDNRGHLRVCPAAEVKKIIALVWKKKTLNSKGEIAGLYYNNWGTIVAAVKRIKPHRAGRGLVSIVGWSFSMMLICHVAQRDDKLQPASETALESDPPPPP